MIIFYAAIYMLTGMALYLPIIMADYRSRPEEWNAGFNVAAIMAIMFWPVGLAYGFATRKKGRE